MTTGTVYVKHSDRQVFAVGDTVRLCLEEGILIDGETEPPVPSIEATVVAIESCNKCNNDRSTMYTLTYDMDLLLPAYSPLDPKYVYDMINVDTCFSNFVVDIINCPDCSWEWLYGDGSDGDLVVTDGEVKYLDENRDYFFDNVTVDEGGVFIPAYIFMLIDPTYIDGYLLSHKVHIRGTLTVNGRLSADGAGATEAERGGVGGDIRMYTAPASGGQSTYGGSGGNGAIHGPLDGQAPGIFAKAVDIYDAWRIGGIGGKGGDGGDAGGTGSYGVGYDVADFFANVDSVSNHTLNHYQHNNIHKFFFSAFDRSELFRALTGAYAGACAYYIGALPYGGGTGGGGGGAGANASAVPSTESYHGGGGGAGGKPVVLYANTVVIGDTGYISSNGGDGGDSFTMPEDGIPPSLSDFAGGGGGGGGGAGGFVYIVHNSIADSGTIESVGGAGGAGHAPTGAGLPGEDGSVGEDGQVVLFNMVTRSFSMI